MRKVQWIVQDKSGKILGIYPTKKRAFTFNDEESVNITKLTWNGFFHSEKPLEYDPYSEGVVKLYEPMF